MIADIAAGLGDRRGAAVVLYAAGGGHPRQEYRATSFAASAGRMRAPMRRT